jgi:hypothetical protein
MGRKFTWTNNQVPPTLTRIDRAFLSPSLEDMYTNLILQPLSSSISDHYPLLLMPLYTPKAQPIFKFEAFWPNLPGFLCYVQQAWGTQIPHNQNPLGVLHIKLSRTVKALKKWSRSLIPQGKMALTICREVINQLDRVQENRSLTEPEQNMTRGLKARILGLSAIQRSRVR